MAPGGKSKGLLDSAPISTWDPGAFRMDKGLKWYPAPPMSSPPPGYTVPPHPGGNRHQVTVPPLGGGGTVHHSRPANSSITQLKIFFGAFGACDFLLISYCSWAK